MAGVEIAALVNGPGPDGLPAILSGDALYIEEGPRTPPVHSNDWPVHERPRRCGWLRLRRHLDVVADPSLPGRFTCVRCGKVRYRVHARDRG